MDRAMDKSLSLKERYWDTTHDIIEDVGNGPQRIFINFRNPADIGFDPEKLMALLSASSGAEDRVLNALRPSLSPAGGSRIDRALRAAKLSRLAARLLAGRGEGRV